MNSLLKRQIDKHLKNGLNNIDQFLLAVDNSYKNFEEQIEMLQHAMKVSSDELYEANQKLREEAASLKEINNNLEFVLQSMGLDSKLTGEMGEFNASDYIKNQTLEILRINKQREELMKNLEKQNKELNDYAHMVSHDLKSPLRSIDTLVNWFIEDNPNVVTQDNRKSLDLILQNVEKMDVLIKGILDYSSVDLQHSNLKVVDLDQLVKSLLKELVIPQKIEVKIESQLPVIKANDFRCKILFKHLIQNAYQYNSKKKGTIQIGCNEDADQIVFYIKDNGDGIPEPYQKKIFNVFSKLDSTNQSSGIGLAISKKIVEIYGGKIWVESNENIGTTVYFTILK